MSPVARVFSGLRQRWRLLLRLLGLALLAWLLLRIDINGALAILSRTNLGLALLAGLLLIPLIALKAIRWMMLIDRAWSWLDFYRATLVYFSGLFLGFLTPGRLGEFMSSPGLTGPVDEESPQKSELIANLRRLLQV